MGMTLFRIETLVLMQLGNKFNVARKGKTAVWINIGLGFAAFCGATLAFFGVFILFKNVLALPMSMYMLSFLMLVTQVLSIIACTSSLTQSLYSSRDNAILLAMPAPHSEVYISKLAVAYINEFIKNLFFVIPLMLSFGFISSQGWWYFLATVIISFFLPLIAVLLGALISIPLMYIKRFLKKAEFVYVILTLAVIALLMFFMHEVLGTLPRPLRILAIYNRMINQIISFMSKVSSYSLFYAWVSDIVFAQVIYRQPDPVTGALSSLPHLSAIYLILFAAALIALNYFLSRPLFFKLASHTAENAVQKEHKGENKPSKSTYSAFLKKDILLSVRNFGALMEEYSLIIAMPFILYFINGFFEAINLSGRGEALALGVNVIVSLMLITASNTSSAAALSKEGSEFVLLKTAPAKTYLITWAKITLNVVLSTLLIILSLIVVGMTGVVNWENLLLCLVVFLLCNAAHIIWSFQFDIKNPLMREYASTGGISSNKNISKSIATGMGISLVMGVVMMALHLLSTPAVTFSVSIGLSVLLLAFRLIMFDLNIKCLFADLEF